MLDRPRPDPAGVVEVARAVLAIPGTGAAIGPYTLDLAAGEIAAIVGPSGSGKTTLVRAIVERRRPLSGTLKVNAGPDDVAYVPQNAAERLNRTATALRHLRDVSRRLSRPAAKELLERFRIPGNALDRPVGTFSAGQQQRLVLLIALSRRPKLVILDEPTSALDVEMRQELALLLRRVAREENVAALVATHHLPFVGVIADRVWQLTRTDGEAKG